MRCSIETLLGEGEFISLFIYLFIYFLIPQRTHEGLMVAEGQKVNDSSIQKQARLAV